MTTRPLYERGRAASIGHAPGEHPGRTDYDLVRRLRSIREGADEAMTAAEQYDPDFCLHLSACQSETDVDEVLTEWLERRLAVLKRTRAEFKCVWSDARKSIKEDDPTS